MGDSTQSFRSVAVARVLARTPRAIPRPLCRDRAVAPGAKRESPMNRIISRAALLLALLAACLPHEGSACILLLIVCVVASATSRDDG